MDRSDTRPNKRQLSAAATKDRLIEATIHCMANYGPAGASVERITEAAGVSRGLVRHHFGNKRQLMIEAFRRLADEERVAFGGEVVSPEADAVATLRTAIITSFGDALAAPARAHAWFGFWQAALGDPTLREINERVYAETRERYSELFRLAARQRGVVIDDRSAGYGLVALSDGAWNELVMDSTDFGVADALALCDEYIDMILERAEAAGEARTSG